MAAVVGWLSHPVTLVAVVVLLVNDHLLKVAYPGPVTGKLSDVAGLVVAPALLAVVLLAVLRRLPANAAAAGSLVLTGAGFAAVKAFEPMAAAVCRVWSLVSGPSVILADPTDLFALPALGLAWWVWSRARRQTPPAPGRIAVLVGLPAAVLAVAATSAPRYPDAIAVTVSQGRFLVGEGNAYQQTDRTPTTWRVSDDAGLTWHHLIDPEPSAAVAIRRHGCVPDDPRHCYRAVPGHLRVQETRDGGTTWTLSWEVPDDRRRLLARRYYEIGDLSIYLSSNALAVLTVPGGHVVVVANGRDGYARRDVAGGWRRIGFGATRSDGRTYTDPAVSLHPDPHGVLRAELVFALLAGLLTLGVGGWQAIGWYLESVMLAGTLVVGAGVMVLSGLTLLHPSSAVDGGFIKVGMSVVGFVIAAVGAVGMLATAAGLRALTGRSVLLIGALGVLIAATCYTVFVGWVRDWYPYRPAVLVALAASSAGIVAAGWLGHRLGHRPTVT